MSNNDKPEQSDSDDQLGPPKEDLSAPPPYEPQSKTQQPSVAQQSLERQPLAAVHAALPLITVDTTTKPTSIGHGKLPTYEEVQLEKSLNGELPPEFSNMHPPPPNYPSPPPNMYADLLSPAHPQSSSEQAHTTVSYITVDNSETDMSRMANVRVLGTDSMFAAAFVIAFVFNWIGFLVVLCFCQTVATRYGAISGFSLSFAKWVIIYQQNAPMENIWLPYVFLAFSILICIRSFIQYMIFKRNWHVLSPSAQQRVLLAP